MTHPIQFSIWTLLVYTAILAILLSAWQIAGHLGMCIASLALGSILLVESIANSKRSLFLTAAALLVFYLFASLIAI